jgi:hypothetical protein
MKALEKIRCLDGFTLKMIMAVFMAMDHLYYYLPGCPLWFHQVSRLVAPLFAFLVAEGMVHTRSRQKYIGRMYLFGGVMVAAWIPFGLIFGTFPPNSVLMSLAITASLIYCIDKLRAKEGEKWIWILLIVVLVGASIIFEGLFICQATGLICYYLRRRPLVMCGVYITVMLLFLFLLGMLFDPQILMVFAVIPFLLYNGKRGVSNAFSKYFFYLFYPLHIWIIFVVQQVFFV